MVSLSTPGPTLLVCYLLWPFTFPQNTFVDAASGHGLQLVSLSSVECSDREGDSHLNWLTSCVSFTMLCRLRPKTRGLPRFLQPADHHSRPCDRGSRNATTRRVCRLNSDPAASRMRRWATRDAGPARWEGPSRPAGLSPWNLAPSIPEHSRVNQSIELITMCVY